MFHLCCCSNSSSTSVCVTVPSFPSLFPFLPFPYGHSRKGLDNEMNMKHWIGSKFGIKIQNPLSSFTFCPTHHLVAPPHLFVHHMLPMWWTNRQTPRHTLARLPTFVIYFLPQHLLCFLLPFSSSIHHSLLNISSPLVLFQVETFPDLWPWFVAAEAHLTSRMSSSYLLLTTSLLGLFFSLSLYNKAMLKGFSSFFVLSHSSNSPLSQQKMPTALFRKTLPPFSSSMAAAFFSA